MTTYLNEKQVGQHYQSKLIRDRTINHAGAMLILYHNISAIRYIHYHTLK